jgi:hypothetical protein
MPVVTIFDLARYANVVLGPVAFAFLCYRAVIGIHERLIVWRPLFILFCGYVLNTALSAPTGLVLDRSATYLSLVAFGLNIALIIVCWFYPGPMTRNQK